MAFGYFGKSVRDAYWLHFDRRIWRMSMGHESARVLARVFVHLALTHVFIKSSSSSFIFPITIMRQIPKIHIDRSLLDMLRATALSNDPRGVSEGVGLQIGVFLLAIECFEVVTVPHIGLSDEGVLRDVGGVLNRNTIIRWLIAAIAVVHSSEGYLGRFLNRGRLAKR